MARRRRKSSKRGPYMNALVLGAGLATGITLISVVVGMGAYGAKKLAATQKQKQLGGGSNGGSAGTTP